MNLVLFEGGEYTRPLPDADPRSRHIREVLRRQPGEAFDCGMVDGPRGRAVVVRHDAAGLHLAFTWHEQPPPALYPITLLIGLPRPQTARKILSEATTLGVAALVFFRADRGEPTYADSTLWSSGEARRVMVAAAEQAFCTRLPRLERIDSLDAAIAVHAPPHRTRLALDNYEAPHSIERTPLHGQPAVLAVGAERGWSDRERQALRAAGFGLAHLGPRVLRTETACAAGVAVLAARLGLWDQGSSV